MISGRFVHFMALVMSVSTWLFCVPVKAIAGNTIFCVATVSQFANAMNYWTASNDNNVVLQMVTNTYALTNASSVFNQSNGGAALEIVGGYTLVGSTCVPGPINGTNTVLDGGSSTSVYIIGNGNITIQGIAVQNMLGSPVNPSPLSVQSLHNGILLDRVIVDGNSAYAGANGGLVTALDGSSGALITDSLFDNNSCAGHPLFCSTLQFSHNGVMTVEVINSTIAGNTALGIEAGNGTTVQLLNDILWNNADGDIQVDSDSVLIVSYSDYTTVSAAGGFSQGSGNIHTDPLFTGNYMLQAGPTLSPAINVGASAAAAALLNGYTYPSVDLFGAPRVVGSRVDMGPYESSYNDQHNFVVTSAADSGPHSLRDAIAQANFTPGPSRITFNIPGSCNARIGLQTPLPAAKYSLSIDGYTEPGSIQNTAAYFFNGTLCVALVPFADAANFALEATSAVSQLNISGLLFAGFSDAAIRIEGGAGHQIIGNVFTGGGIYPDNNDAIRVTANAGGTLIGGSNASDLNVINNSVGAAVHLDNSAGGSVVADNLIGFGSDGVFAAGNFTGILVFNSPGNILRGNFVGNSTGAGIVLAGPNSAANIVQGNLIGVGSALSAPNAVAGVLVQAGANQNSIGALSATDVVGGNTIWDNGGPGVWISTSGGVGNSVLANDLESNGGPSFDNGLAIDLGNLGPNPNSFPPAPTGPNDYQNFPVLSYSLLTVTNTLLIGGTLDAAPSQQFRLDFYMSQAAPTGSLGRGYAGQFVGTALVTTSAGGHCDFSINLPFNSANLWVSATATSLAGPFLVPQNTSEIGNVVHGAYDEIFVDGFGN